MKRTDGTANYFTYSDILKYCICLRYLYIYEQCHVALYTIFQVLLK